MTDYKRPILISPSMMCADSMHLDDEVSLFEAERIPLLHIDIMDGHFVPNFTLGPDYCSRLATRTPIPLDIHLMIENVDAFVPVFASFGKPWLCFHPETSYHPLRTLSLIRASGARPGIAIDPAITVESLKYLLPECDYVCVMTVNPGYAGQKLIPSSLEKIRELRSYIDAEGLDVRIEVDGNVSWTNIPAMIDAGAEVLVAGTSSLFAKDLDRREAIHRLLSMTAGHDDPAPDAHYGIDHARA